MLEFTASVSELTSLQTFRTCCLPIPAVVQLVRNHMYGIKAQVQHAITPHTKFEYSDLKHQQGKLPSRLANSITYHIADRTLNSPNVHSHKSALEHIVLTEHLVLLVGVCPCIEPRLSTSVVARLCTCILARLGTVVEARLTACIVARLSTCVVSRLTACIVSRLTACIVSRLGTCTVASLCTCVVARLGASCASGCMACAVAGATCGCCSSSTSWTANLVLHYF